MIGHEAVRNKRKAVTVGTLPKLQYAAPCDSVFRERPISMCGACPEEIPLGTDIRHAWKPTGTV